MKIECLLVSTEVAARGLDFFEVQKVIVFDVPSKVDIYINMIGRTARINQKGCSHLYLMPNESRYLEILKKRQLSLSELSADEVYKSAKTHPKDKIVEKLRDLTTSFCSNPDRKSLSRRAFNSFVRSYGHNNKKIFALKDLNLKALTRAFGLDSVFSKNGETEKASYLEGNRVKKLEKDYDAKRNRDRGVSKAKFGGKMDSKKLALMEFM